MQVKSTLFAIVALAAAITSDAFADDPDPILLWPDGAPGAVGDEAADKPQLRLYLAEAKQNTRAAVVVCPGGGYGALATDHEGVQLARWFNRRGVNAAVLKYRLGPRYRHPAPLQDVQRAIRYVRANAKQLNVAPDRIGVMGFSAGGHLASTAATQFASGDAESKDAIERVSSRPDFAILCYAVISMSEPFGHRGSRRNLLGERAEDPKWMVKMSSEKQVTPQTPPTFLFHTGEDRGVPVENSLAFYAACRKAGVPAELHVYQNGPHGVGMSAGDPVVSSWLERLHGWMATSGFLSSAKRADVQGTVKLNGQPLRWGTIAFLPKDENQPVAWSMVSRGRFAIPPERGAVVGTLRVVIHNLGGVTPAPTIDDVQKLRSDSLVVEVVEGAKQNTFNFELTD